MGFVWELEIPKSAGIHRHGRPDLLHFQTHPYIISDWLWLYIYIYIYVYIHIIYTYPIIFPLYSHYIP